MTLSKRDLLFALVGLGASAIIPSASAEEAEAFDLSAGRAIGEAYRAANPDEDWSALAQDLLPGDATAEALARLRVRVAADFRAGRLFVYEGWRLSRTEGQLFALLAAT